MPRATNNILDTKRVDLKSCPEGFVVLRRMTYGQWLKRQEIAMTLQMKQGESNGKGSRPEMVADVAIAGTEVARWEFSCCVAEHNLEDDQGQPLDFKSAFMIDLLDPRIGQEIGREIDKMNQFEEDLGN
jgi:hypothetical protein